MQTWCVFESLELSSSLSLIIVPKSKSSFGFGWYSFCTCLTGEFGSLDGGVG